MTEIAVGQQQLLNGGFATSRTAEMTYRSGEEVARVVVPGGVDENAARAALLALLRDARAQAAARGAKGHVVADRALAAADILERSDPKTGAVIAPDAIERAIVDAAARRVQDQAIVATSTLNAFTGEVVSLDLAVLPNPLVYKRNEMLSETRIDGSLPEDQILRRLQAFVAGSVRDRAIQDRMIPRTGTAAPFGEVPASDWFGLVQTVKRAGRSVRVQAVAEGDTRAADPLRLDFRVK